ncbi:MAG: ion transporter [Rhodospirillales bacterium]|nr:ion transporter [Rhodospirillales bacterium]
MTISEIVQRSDTLPGRMFDLTVIVLILVSVVTASIDTLPNLAPSIRAVLSWSEIVIVGLFTIEYGLRIGTAPRKLRYVFGFQGIVDLAAILPFYLTLGGVDLRTLRVLQLFRIVRVLKLSRYSVAMARFGKAMALAKEEIVLFACVAIALLYLSAAGIWYFEHEAQPEAFASILHSLWWATATLTTVGYGDVYPVTMGGRLFTFVILMCGLGIVAVPAGLVAAALSRVRQEETQSGP